MPATRTGTASQVDGSGASGTPAITVPSDCNLVVALWSHWDDDGSTTLSTLSIDGGSFSVQAELAEGVVSNESGIGVATLVNPSTGSQNLTFAWSSGGARAEGGEIVLVYIKDANTGDPVRDSDVDATTGSTDVSITIDTASDDLIIGLAETFTGNTPAISLTAFINNATLNSHVYDVGDDTTPSSPTHTVDMTGEYYGSIVAISLKAAAAVEGSRAKFLPLLGVA